MLELCVCLGKNLSNNVYLFSFVILPRKLRKFFFVDYKNNKVHKHIKSSTTEFKNMYINPSLICKSHTSLRTLKEKTEVRCVPEYTLPQLWHLTESLYVPRVEDKLAKNSLLETFSLSFSVWTLLGPFYYRTSSHASSPLLQLHSNTSPSSNPAGKNATKIQTETSLWGPPPSITQPAPCVK